MPNRRTREDRDSSKEQNGYDSSDLHLQQNVQEHATPLAGAGVETGVEVHVTGDVADSAASGGCSVSPCSGSF